MFKNKYVVTILIIVVSVLISIFFIKARNNTNGNITKEIHPYRGDIKLTVTTTGVVEPQNRLEIKPSINGRIEKILVQEGDVLAYMSSTERAALLDAARSQGDQTRQYWEEVYKQTPIISPIDGEVIVRSVEPGQTVTVNDPVLVLSDRLIVSAQFDETDIGSIKIGQRAVITLDAYPGTKIKGKVDHIAYESNLVNNVNIYDVDVLPEEVPEFFRSGMSANVEVIEQEKTDILLVPVEALTRENNKTFVMVKKGLTGRVQKHEIETGISDEKNIEVTSGLTAEDVIVIANKTFSLNKKEPGGNPFMPSRRRSR
jgi:macrolide-specific efflux system membrane fusion protein